MLKVIECFVLIGWYLTCLFKKIKLLHFKEQEHEVKIGLRWKVTSLEEVHQRSFGDGMGKSEGRMNNKVFFFLSLDSRVFLDTAIFSLATSKVTRFEEESPSKGEYNAVPSLPTSL